MTECLVAGTPVLSMKMTGANEHEQVLARKLCDEFGMLSQSIPASLLPWSAEVLSIPLPFARPISPHKNKVVH